VNLDLYLNSLQALSLSLFFKIRGVLSIKTCLEGGIQVNLTMHASRDAPPTSFIKSHAKDKHGGGQDLVLQEYYGDM
jgi:hypothetical protein